MLRNRSQSPSMHAKLTKGLDPYKEMIKACINFTNEEFAKMLREVANIYSKLGDEPLLKEGYEYNAIRDAVQYVTNKHDFGYFIQPWKDEFLRMPFDVTKRKKWADYVAECHATGKEIDYDNYDWDK